MSGNRLPWITVIIIIIIIIIIILIDAGMPLCHYVDTEVYKWPFHLNSKDFCVPWANRCPENAEPFSTLSWLF